MTVIKKNSTRDLFEKYDYSQYRSSEKTEKMLKASIEPVSMKEAVTIFNDIDKVFPTLFNFAAWGCYLKAQMVCGYLFESGIRPKKAWCIYEDHPDKNEEASLISSSESGWRYHVSTIISVRDKNEKPIEVVIDNTMFDGPVTVASWASSMAGPTKQILVTDYDSGFEDGQGCMYQPKREMKTVSHRELFDDFDRFNSFVNVRTFPNRYKSKLRVDFEKAQDGLLKAHYTKNAKVIKPRLSI